MTEVRWGAGMGSVRARQAASSSGPNAPNRPRPAYVRRGGRSSIRQSFVANAGAMSEDERGTFAAQLRRERAERHLRHGGGSFMRVHWVAVPKALRARRVNRRRRRRRRRRGRLPRPWGGGRR
jgi:hypothetical protein